MGALAHLSRGIKAAYQNVGISALIVLLSVVGSWMTMSLSLAFTESWGVLYMAAVLSGEKAQWSTLEKVMTIRAKELVLAALLIFACYTSLIGLLVLVGIGGSVGIALMLGQIQALTVAGVMVFLLSVLASLIMLGTFCYVMLSLIFVPYLVTIGERNISDAFRESWQKARQFGVFKIGWILTPASLLGMAGILVCCVGVFFTWPIFYGTVGSLYHEIFGLPLPQAEPATPENRQPLLSERDPQP